MNNQIFFFFYNLAHHSAFLDKAIIFTAVYLPYIVILSAGIFLLFYHEVLPSKNPFQASLDKWKEIGLVFLSGIIAWCFASVIKIVIHTPRPFLSLPQVQSLFPETGFSFPSGHATFFSALAVAIFLKHKKAGYIFMFCALLIGLARIASGVHFPIDILGGFLLGPSLVLILNHFYKKL